MIKKKKAHAFIQEKGKIIFNEFKHKAGQVLKENP